MRQLGSTELKRLHREWRKDEPRRLALLLEGLASPWNLGAIIRTAAAYRVEHLYLAGMQISPASCLLYTSPSPRDATLSRMPSSA